MKEIAVVSKNKALARLIELEAMSCGAIPKLFVSFPKDADSFSVVFIDVDSVDFVSAHLGEKVVAISAGYAEDMPQRLTYPPSLIRIREYILSSGRTAASNNNFELIGDKKVIYFDDRQCSIRLGAESCHLSEYEMKLLRYLCDRFGNTVSRAELSELLGVDKGNICDVYICHLRKKLENNGERKIIYTVRNQGYMTKYKAVNIE